MRVELYVTYNKAMKTWTCLLIVEVRIRPGHVLYVSTFRFVNVSISSLQARGFIHFSSVICRFVGVWAKVSEQQIRTNVTTWPNGDEQGKVIRRNGAREPEVPKWIPKTSKRERIVWQAEPWESTNRRLPTNDLKAPLVWGHMAISVLIQKSINYQHQV